MFPGSPARLLPGTTLVAVLRLARPGPPLGVWVRGSGRPAALRWHRPDGWCRLLAADDLGYLLGRCAVVAVRDGDRVLPVPSAVLLRWRVLEIVLAAPYLPPPHQLRVLFPAARVRDGVVTLPLGLGSAEEALAICAEARLSVAETRIAYVTAER